MADDCNGACAILGEIDVTIFNLSLPLRAFVFKHSLLLICSAGLLYYCFPVGGSLDLALIQPYIDQSAHFPLRQNWALVKLSHQAVKYILIGVYLLLLLQCLASFVFQSWRDERTTSAYFFILVVLSTTCIGVLKSQAVHACPWDMVMLGPQGMMWDFSATQGHCFPGGHAATGFALMTGYFIYQQQPKRAYFFLIASLILGLAMGWAQMMRGAHFMSHNLWTAWIIYCINVMAYILFASRLKLKFIKP